MRSWTIKEVKLALTWARTPELERIPLEELSTLLERSPEGIRRFLSRVLPPGERPWNEKPRWMPGEVDTLKEGGVGLPRRTYAAARKFAQRHPSLTGQTVPEDDGERTSVSVSQLSADLGISRSAVYRLLGKGLLRRFKGGIAETSFRDLLQKHPEAIPYSSLPRDHREWLVLNGYSDPSLVVKQPSVRGLLD